VKALLGARPGNTIPSISPMCAQARRRFTQAIHMVVHSKACNTFSCRAGRQRVSVPVLARGGRHTGHGSGLGLDAIAHDGGHRMLAAHPAGQAARVPRRLAAVTLIVILPAARPRYAQAARAQSPPARRGRPGTSPVLGRTPDHRGRRSRGCRGPTLAGRSCRAESGTAPPCMRWRGRARPRRAGWPVAWSSPRTARRPPGPGTHARGRSPGSSRVPGVAPGWCLFPAVKALLLPPQAQRKALRPAISCFSAINGRLHRKAGSYPHFTAVIHGFTHSLPTGYRM
jgi:hypothetical protein